ncbi:hypothetical protein S7335_4857 [Synechococcus sp. PCC 7335]|uniref:hypothetical protein n=1 Tax=Synechococcus sp. (strain ATCC 29403 / PCC 7335) TaxID=91464 RepID=UPI00017EB7F4|nr:hypothetical protein [Synechococcus sp. PCC 7335]EDX87150.1 hypothetical protein S7335_4857 [Synechococcus sp. PCC 7335]
MANDASVSKSAVENVSEKSDEKANEKTPKSLLEVTLDGAIALAKDSGNYRQATVQFEALLAQIDSEHPEIVPLLKTIWQEYLSAQRSATFWQNMSDAEKDLSEKMSESNIQLKQNYMRLIQEQ